jgi:chemotaxis response regulator CheB
MLNQYSSLTAMQAEDNDAIRHGWIYVAPPDHHRLLASSTCS